MKVQNAVKKLEKAGFKVEVSGTHYHASKENTQYVIEFIKNGGDSEEAICINVRRTNDNHNSMIDYFAGIWCDNISQAIRVLQQIKQGVQI
jgi:hypothetical protein